MEWNASSAFPPEPKAGVLKIGAAAESASCLKRCIMRKMFKLLVPTLLLGLVPSLQAAPPGTCQVFCVTSPCSSNSDCNAAPNGRCNFACPKTGCCVYD